MKDELRPLAKVALITGAISAAVMVAAVVDDAINNPEDYTENGKDWPMPNLKQDYKPKRVNDRR